MAAIFETVANVESMEYCQSVSLTPCGNSNNVTIANRTVTTVDSRRLGRLTEKRLRCVSRGYSAFLSSILHEVQLAIAALRGCVAGAVRTPQRGSNREKGRIPSNQGSSSTSADEKLTYLSKIITIL